MAKATTKVDNKPAAMTRKRNGQSAAPAETSQTPARPATKAKAVAAPAEGVSTNHCEPSTTDRKRNTSDSETRDTAVISAIPVAVPQPLSATEVPAGKARSGRVWKATHKRASAVLQVSRAIKKKSKFDLRRQDELKLKQVREYELKLKADVDAAKQAERERIKELKERREKNRLKAEIVQKISNPNKIKRMKKKQLRMIEMRDTL